MALADPAPRRRMLVIINPVATKMSDRLKSLVVYALQGRYDVTTADTERKGHAIELCRAAAAEGYDVVVAFGGDGTVNEAANGLAGTRTALTCLPAGSNNVVAKLLGIPTDVGGMAIAYRTDLFKAAGLPTDRDEVSKLWPTWDAFMEVGKKYVQATGKPFLDNTPTSVFFQAVNQGTERYYNTDHQLDYDNADNPRPVRAIRDELRQVGPGLYLGLAYVMWRKRPRLVLYFGLARP